MPSKLVRNLIPNIITQNETRIPHFYYASEEEYWQRLKDKLLEETNEFIASENYEEIADILEVIDAIITFKELSFDDIKAFKEKKAKSNGTFSERIILTSRKEKQ